MQGPQQPRPAQYGNVSMLLHVATLRYSTPRMLLARLVSAHADGVQRRPQRIIMIVGLGWERAASYIAKLRRIELKDANTKQISLSVLGGRRLGCRRGPRSPVHSSQEQALSWEAKGKDWSRLTQKPRFRCQRPLPIRTLVCIHGPKTMKRGSRAPTTHLKAAATGARRVNCRRRRAAPPPPALVLVYHSSGNTWVGLGQDGG